MVFVIKMKSKTQLQNILRTLKINFKHNYKTEMILKTDRLRYESLKITHNELCFMSIPRWSIQLEIRSRRRLQGQHKIHIYTFDIISVFNLK